MKMFLSFMATLCVIFVGSVSPVRADDDLLLAVVALIAGLPPCEAGEFDQCKNRRTCNLINGNWGSDKCTMKSSNQLGTELLAGEWSLTTSLQNGDFFNYLQFEKSTVNTLGSLDYYIEGFSHSSTAYSDLSPNYVVGSYDSSNDDWFILDFWGLDIGTISSIEVNRVSDSYFAGCEFFLNYPDLTYEDGICNPVRMQRSAVVEVGVNPSSNIRGPSNLRKSQGSEGTNKPTKRTAGSKVRNSAFLINSVREVSGEDHG